MFIGKERLAKPDFEVQARELLRAREWFIRLFSDHSPLFTLGYRPNQIEKALPVLRLLEDEGHARGYNKGIVELVFENPRNPDAEACYLHQCPYSHAFIFSAYIDEHAWKNEYYTPEMLLWLDIFTPNPISWLPSCHGRIAHIILLSNREHTENLDFLAQTILKSEYFPGKMLKNNPLTELILRLPKRQNRGPLYEAAWGDERKNELYIKALVPHIKPLYDLQYYSVWKKLPPITEDGQTLFPLGERPNASFSKVQRVFEQKKVLVTERQMTKEPATI